MDEAVEDGVGIGRVADDGVPAFDGELAGDDSGAASVAFLEDLEQVVSGLGVERLETPVVEDEELDAAEGANDGGIAAVAAGEGEIAEQLGDALVEDGAVVATGLVAEGASQPTFADRLGGPVGPQMTRLSWASIQSPMTSFWKSWRSRPRADR